VAGSGSLSPDREIYGRIRLSVARSGDLLLDPALCRRIGSSVAGSLFLYCLLSRRLTSGRGFEVWSLDRDSEQELLKINEYNGVIFSLLQNGNVSFNEGLDES
jgi:hypothetical protein